MERDFMGLAVKQETTDETMDAAPLRSSAMQWSFSNSGSAPQLLSFQAAQEEKPKTGFDSLTSTGLVTVTTTEAAQKSIVPEKQGGVRYMVTTHSVANQANLTISPAVTTAVRQLFVAGSGQNLIGSVSSQPVDAVTVANPVPAMPSSSPVVGTTDLRNTSKVSGTPAQLTIFYNGSVCVYDNISPEKAQAIMLLAGNGPPLTSNATPAAAPVQASVPRSSVLDGFVISQPYGTTPHHPSPVPVTSINVSQSAVRSGNNNDAAAAKPAGVIISSSTIAQPLKAANSLGSVSATFLSSDTVPQFRRKSLARFLEKRKERVITASPYADKQSPDCSNPRGGSAGLSVNSSGSCAVPAVN
ncbi:protein TIFY 6B isoform X1 [Sesamum indicum]|uniref:Protein TIFY n=2 Tax=Sesamum indicum TaxID=4182 RepID=A0A6I9SPF8_SESIN|nr:protein TIFY 6B isoform X1 [Sesamum indicum]